MGSPDTESATVGQVLCVVVRTAAARVTGTETAALDDEPDGVHQHRTAVRRLRSVLAGFRAHLDEAATNRLRVEFAVWGQQLGLVRDTEVRADVAAAAIDELDLVDPDVWRRLVDDERDEYGRAHARLRHLWDEPRARARRAALREFAADVPLTGEPDTDAADVRAVVRDEVRRVRRAANRSDGSIESLHAVRKAGRRLRYVAEALSDAAPELFGEDCAEFAEAGEAIHDVFGNHRDVLVFLEQLQLTRARAGRAGERVESYDLLVSRAQQRVGEFASELGDVLKRVGAAMPDQ
ncbi:CHAD domain-containing protein [Microbacterium sp. BWT-B31]|uniref:CHAD domain-containing protein n=1 Tax=Microbacterium sp. BWT-B31 TaxID=3232072 RepID=UPI003528EC25